MKPRNFTFDMLEIGKIFEARRGKYAELDREQECALIAEVQNGKQSACQQLIDCNLPFIIKIVRQYVFDEERFQDILQEALIGFLLGVRKFDPAKQVGLRTYATWWIKQRILVSNSLQSTWKKTLDASQKKLRYLTEELLRQTGRYPDAADLVVYYKKVYPDAEFDLRKAQEWLTFYASNKISSLDDPVPDLEGVSLIDSVRGETGEEIEQLVINEQSISLIADAVRQLTDEEQRLIRMRYWDELGEDNIAQAVGQTRERIRQKLSKLQRKLRTILKTNKYQQVI